MNLWVNRLGQLAILAVALFFFSCEDETSYLGYRNPNKKFKGKYVEIPLNSSVFLLDSIRTSNYFFNNEYNRFVVGAFEEPEQPQLGKIVSHAASQFYITTDVKIPAEVFTASDAENKLDSVTLDLQLDYYTYGDKDASDQSISIYELGEKLDFTAKKSYLSYRPVTGLGSMIGQKVFNVDPKRFTDSLKESSPDPWLVRVRLNQEFSNKIYDLARKFSIDSDSTIVKYDLFIEQIKGIYIEASAANDKVVGIASAGATGIVLHFTTKGKQSQQRFTFANLANYSNVQSTFNGTDLAQLPKYTDLVTDSGKRYVQGGTGLVTKVSLENFYSFASQDSTRNILLNSAELSIDGVVISAPDLLEPPSYLAIRWLNDLQRLVRVGDSPASTRQADLYRGGVTMDYRVFNPQAGDYVGNVLVDNNRNLLGVNDGGSPAALAYSPTNKRYNGFLTLLFLQLLKNKNEPERFNNFVLFPASPSAPSWGMKSVNRAVFPSGKIVLKIFYTEPTVNQDN